MDSPQSTNALILLLGFLSSPSCGCGFNELGMLISRPSHLLGTPQAFVSAPPLHQESLYLTKAQGEVSVTPLEWCRLRSQAFLGFGRLASQS